MNRPPAVAAKYLRNSAGTKVAEDGESMVRKGKFSIPQLRQIWAGSPQPIDDVRDAKAAEREREVQLVEERRKAQEQEQSENEEFYRKMIAPAPTSSNGHSKQPTSF